MAKSKKQALLIGVYGTVPGGLILAILLSQWCRSLAWEIATWCGGVVVGLLRHLGAGISIPFAVFYTLAIVCLVAAVRFIASLLRPSYLAYRDDTFFGMRWAWDYDTKGRMANVVPRCPQDSTLLVWHELAKYGGPPTVMFRCETCRAEYGPFDGRQKNVVQQVQRQIERKVTTGEWKQTLARQRSRVTP